MQHQSNESDTNSQKIGPIACWIYRSPRQEQMYLYLIEKERFDRLPAELMRHFGTPSLVMELTLHPGRKLAREDTASVMRNLKERGYHLQMPPKIDVELNRGD